MHMRRRKLFLCISYKMKYLQNEAIKQKSIKEVTLQFSIIFHIRQKNNTVNFRVICSLKKSLKKLDLKKKLDRVRVEVRVGVSVRG